MQQLRQQNAEKINRVFMAMDALRDNSSTKDVRNLFRLKKRKQNNQR